MAEKQPSAYQLTLYIADLSPLIQKFRLKGKQFRYGESNGLCCHRWECRKPLLPRYPEPRKLHTESHMEVLGKTIMISTRVTKPVVGGNYTRQNTVTVLMSAYLRYQRHRS